ncbi:site-specific integrase [Conexibacter sp. S30A1]|uniref:tyrosine-type recombinase/integrase n=1 Tax=Conexibacter sp. S30A1 TaxID=2937800 RepID=UPI00200FC34E|nr:site-specific integrase [Conexibacter sp. S30A1]
MTTRVTGHVSLRQRQRGPVYYLKYRLADGRQVQKLLGPAWTERGRPPAGCYTRKMAEDKLAEILTDERRGTLAVEKSGATFADAAAEFLRYIEQDREREPVTIGDYRGVINGYLLPRFGERDIASITAQEIERYRDELKALKRPDGSRRLSNRVVVRHLVVLNGIFKRAARVWKIQVNPASADLVDRPPVRYDSGAYKTLEPDEVRLVASRMKVPEESALVLTAAFTGLRLGELLALRWRDVDWSLRRVHVERSLSQFGVEKVPKSGKVRSSVLVDEVAAALDSLSRRELFTAPDNLVFCSQTGTYLSHGMMRRRFYAALDGAGLPRVRLHDLRHCFATFAVQAFDVPKVQGFMGHAHVSTTMRYWHRSPAHDDAARLQQVLGSTCPETCPELPATERNSEQLSTSNRP